MTDQSSLDAALDRLGAQVLTQAPADFMDGVWLRAGQLGEISERRRRAALFAGLFVVGLGAGAGTMGLPYTYASSPQIAYSDFASGEQLSPAALLHVGR